MIAIRRAAKKEIQQLGKENIELEDLVINSVIEELFVPPISKQAEILTGSAIESATKLAGIFKEKGLI